MLSGPVTGVDRRDEGDRGHGLAPTRVPSRLPGTLNSGTSSDGTTSNGCFADHCHWRLPATVEPHTIVDRTAPGCRDGRACIDQTVFGPTISFFYWSATTEADFPGFACLPHGETTRSLPDGTSHVAALMRATMPRNLTEATGGLASLRSRGRSTGSGR